MPNCDFYATTEDHEPILDWLFAEAACDVYELASEFEQPLKRFSSSWEVLSQFERTYPDGNHQHRVDLQLYVLGAGPSFELKKITINPAACGGAKFRYTAEGWGLVQLYLSTSQGRRLENSHTNHNSELRAKAWAPVHATESRYSPEAWDFAAITAFSSRLNRQIRKRGVAKIGRRVVMPGALALWDAGMSLGPYEPGKHVLLRNPG